MAVIIMRMVKNLCVVSVKLVGKLGGASLPVSHFVEGGALAGEVVREFIVEEVCCNMAEVGRTTHIV